MSESVKPQVFDNESKFESNSNKILDESVTKKVETSLASEDDAQRGKWSKKIEFILACLSFVVGFGNVWRFPYICYRNGGGAFMIPYIAVVIFLGLPFLIIEMCLGQYSGSGTVLVWKFMPIFKGIGWAMIIMVGLLSVYYNMLIAWTMYFFFASFTLKDLPWSSCDNSWNTNMCKIINRDDKNKTENQKFKSPSDEYFHRRVLDLSDSIEEIDSLNWRTVVCLFISWVCIFLCLSKGIKSIGKVAYFTAIFPYICLAVLLIRGLTLEGSSDGIKYLLTPDWDKLAKSDVWIDACEQIFFSLGIAWGTVITLSSYNKFDNNIFKDALIVAFGNSFTSIFAGIVLFSYLGSIAFERGVEISDVATKGAGLAFVLYPDAVARFPLGQIWSIVFFLMLLLLGFGTQLSTMESIITTIFDLKPEKRKMKPFVVAAICFVFFCCGLVFCTNVGMYLFQLVDNYCATIAAMIIGLVEITVIAWIYGINKFMNNINEMLGHYPIPKLYWRIIWQFVCPILIFVLLVLSFMRTTNPFYGNYIFPKWSVYVGWLLTTCSVIAIPIIAIYQLYLYFKSSSQYPNFRSVTCPDINWKSTQTISFHIENSLSVQTHL